MYENRNIDAMEFFRTVQPPFKIRVVAKVLLDLNEVSQADLARETGLNVQTVYGTLNGHRHNPRVMAAVSRKLGIPARELFNNGQA